MIYKLVILVNIKNVFFCSMDINIYSLSNYKAYIMNYKKLK